MLMVASDRLSAFDVVMAEPIPGKGRVLTQMALFWFARLGHVVPNHLTGDDPESVVAADEREQVRGRSMLVKRLKPLPIEAVVRGYLAGSGWKEYQQSGAVCGVHAAAGPEATRRSCRRRSSRRRPRPRWATTTRTSTSSARPTSSAPTSRRKVRDIAIRLYSEAAAFALDARASSSPTPSSSSASTTHGTLTLMDEVLTPDSSRFWPADELRRGQQPAELRQAGRARLARSRSRRRQAVEQEGAGAAAAGRGGRGRPRRALPRGRGAVGATDALTRRGAALRTAPCSACAGRRRRPDRSAPPAPCRRSRACLLRRFGGLRRGVGALVISCRMAT